MAFRNIPIFIQQTLLANGSGLFASTFSSIKKIIFFQLLISDDNASPEWEAKSVHEKITNLRQSLLSDINKK